MSHTPMMDSQEEILQEACVNSTGKRFMIGKINNYEVRECTHSGSGLQVCLVHARDQYHSLTVVCTSAQILG